MKQSPFSALLLALAATAAQAADPATIERPDVKAGQTWRSVVKDGMTKAEISDTTYTVASVSDGEVVIKDATGEPVIVLDAAHYGLKRYHDRVFQPMLQRLQFPLAVGNRWESAYRFENPACGTMDAKLSFKVAGWDDVTTPAGKFRAMRIESDGRWRCGQGAGQFVNKHWVAPDIAVPLKQESIVNSMGRMHSYEVHELQSFTKP